jgi:hypothetical protein
MRVIQPRRLDAQAPAQAQPKEGEHPTVVVFVAGHAHP